MSALLSQLEGRERRAECLRNDAASQASDGTEVAVCVTEQDCCQPDFCKATGGCEKAEDREGWRPVAWMHEFTDPHTGQRTQQPRLRRPRDYELQPGDVVTPMYFRPVSKAARRFFAECEEEARAILRSAP